MVGGGELNAAGQPGGAAGNDGPGSRLGLCVIGCGDFARTFAQSVRGRHPDIDLYFASRDPERARRYAAELGGVGHFGSYAPAAESPAVNAWYICTPHHLHLEHCRMAAAAGQHILLEKPIARSVAEGQAVAAAARAAGVTLMVAENYRFLPAARQAKVLLDGGILGGLRLLQLQEQFPFRPQGWRNDRALNGGGTLIDGGIHKLSLLAYLAGRPAELYAAAVPSAQPGLADEDGVVIMSRGVGGEVGLINHSWSAGPHTTSAWGSIAGTQASIVFEFNAPSLELIDAQGRRRIALDDDDPRGLNAMLREFAAAVHQGRPPAMTTEDAIADVALVAQAYESIRQGRPIPAAIP